MSASVTQQQMCPEEQGPASEEETLRSEDITAAAAAGAAPAATATAWTIDFSPLTSSSTTTKVFQSRKSDALPTKKATAPKNHRYPLYLPMSTKPLGAC